MTPAIEIQFLFDFGSPNAYLSHKLIPAIEKRTGARFAYVPILLGGLFKLANNRSPGEAYADIPNKLAYEHLELRRFLERYGLNAFQRNPNFPVNTLQIMRGAIAAQDLGCFSAYVDTVYGAMWERGRDMAKIEVISAELDTAGLPSAAILDRSRDEGVKARLAESTRRAHERGAFGSPTFFFGDDIYFGKDKLRDLEEALVRTTG